MLLIRKAVIVQPLPALTLRISTKMHKSKLVENGHLSKLLIAKAMYNSFLSLSIIIIIKD